MLRPHKVSLTLILLCLVGCRHASTSTPTPVEAEGREADRFPLSLWSPQPTFAGRSIRESGLGNFKPFRIKNNIKILNKHVDLHHQQARSKTNLESQNKKKSKLDAKKNKKRSKKVERKKNAAKKYKVANHQRLKTQIRLKKNKERKKLIRTLLLKHKKSLSNEREGKIQLKQSKKGGKIQLKPSKKVVYKQVTAACLVDIETGRFKNGNYQLQW